MTIGPKLSTAHQYINTDRILTGRSFGLYVAVGAVEFGRQDYSVPVIWDTHRQLVARGAEEESGREFGRRGIDQIQIYSLE